MNSGTVLQHQDVGFWEVVYCFIENHADDSALDYIYHEFDQMFVNCEFSRADVLLTSVNINRLNITSMLAVLSITRLAKEYLSNRNIIFDLIKARIKNLDPDRACALLSGLE